MHHNDVIAYGKAIDVSTLDPELPSQRIDDWLRTGPAGSKKLMWGVTFSCEPGGERTPAPADESPLCVTAVFPQGNISRWATIEIGTFDKGPSGPPRLKFIAVQPMGKDERTRLTSDKLSDLPRLLEINQGSFEESALLSCVLVASGLLSFFLLFNPLLFVSLYLAASTFSTKARLTLTSRHCGISISEALESEAPAPAISPFLRQEYLLLQKCLLATIPGWIITTVILSITIGLVVGGSTGRQTFEYHLPLQLLTAI